MIKMKLIDLKLLYQLKYLMTKFDCKKRQVQLTRFSYPVLFDVFGESNSHDGHVTSICSETLSPLSQEIFKNVSL